MIHKDTFTKEWIQRKSTDYKRGRRKADPTLIEKVTKALHQNIDCITKVPDTTRLLSKDVKRIKTRHLTGSNTCGVSFCFQIL